MTDFEREDMELKAIMGDKFQDGTEAPKKAEPKKASTDTTHTIPSGIAKPSKVWSPFNAKPGFTQKLMACVKWAAPFGGLNMLIFYWQLNGLMAESIAIPSMWVCCALAGFGVGLNAWWWNK